MLIKTKDFILRSPKKSDLLEFHKNRNDPVIAKNMYHGKYPLSLKEAKKEFNYLFNKDKKSEYFIIDLNGKLIGSIYLMDINKNHKARIGYWIGREFRGKGIGTKSLKIVSKYGFKTYNLKRITANVVTFNKASARALEKAGFKLEGILRKNRYKNKKYYDDFLYAKLR